MLPGPCLQAGRCLWESCVLSGVSARGCSQKAIPLSFALMPMLTVLKSVGTSSCISENGHQKNKTKVLGVGRVFLPSTGHSGKLSPSCSLVLPQHHYESSLLSVVLTVTLSSVRVAASHEVQIRDHSGQTGPEPLHNFTGCKIGHSLQGARSVAVASPGRAYSLLRDHGLSLSSMVMVELSLLYLPG